MRLRGEVLRPDGSDAIGDDMVVPIEDGPQAVTEMAAKLLEQAGRGFFYWRES